METTNPFQSGETIYESIEDNKIDSKDLLDIKECSICLNIMIYELAVLSCKHEFHLDCISLWINKKKSYNFTCPLCQNMTEIINIYNKKTELLPYPLEYIQPPSIDDTNYNNLEINNINILENNQTSSNQTSINQNINNSQTNGIIKNTIIQNYKTRTRTINRCCNIL